MEAPLLSSLELDLKLYGLSFRAVAIFQSSLLYNGLRVISRLQLYLQFIFQLKYENDVKIWLLKLLLQKLLITKI